MRTYARQSGEDNLAPPGEQWVPFGGTLFKCLIILSNTKGQHLKRSTQVQKGEQQIHRPQCQLLGQNQRGARRLDMKIGGPNTSSSFVWTLAMNKINTKDQPPTHPTHPTPATHHPTSHQQHRSDSEHKCTTHPTQHVRVVPPISAHMGGLCCSVRRGCRTFSP